MTHDQVTRAKVFMFPGLDGTGQLFEAAIKTCPPEIDAVPVPLPASDALDYDQLCIEVSDRIKFDGPHIFLAESFSGPLVLKLAARKSPGLIGVVLINSFIRAPISRFIRFLPWRWLFQLRPPQWALRRWLVGPNAAESSLHQVRATIRQVEPSVLSSRIRLVCQCDASKDLRNCKVPILYLRGRNDNLIPQEAVDLLCRYNTNIQIVEINGPHFLLQIHPKECWHQIQQFIQRNEKRC